MPLRWASLGISPPWMALAPQVLRHASQLRGTISLPSRRAPSLELIGGESSDRTNSDDRVFWTIRDEPRTAGSGTRAGIAAKDGTAGRDGPGHRA